MDNLSAIKPKDGNNFDIFYRKRKKYIYSYPLVDENNNYKTNDKINKKSLDDFLIIPKYNHNPLPTIPPNHFSLHTKYKRNKKNLHKRRINSLSIKYLTLYDELEYDSKQFKDLYCLSDTDKETNKIFVRRKFSPEMNSEDNYTNTLNQLKLFDNIPKSYINNLAERIADCFNNNKKITHFSDPVVIHNVYLKFILDRVVHKVEIRNQYNQIITVENIMNLLYDEIDRFQCIAHKIISPRQKSRNKNLIKDQQFHFQTDTNNTKVNDFLNSLSNKLINEEKEECTTSPILIGSQRTIQTKRKCSNMPSIESCAHIKDNSSSLLKERQTDITQFTTTEKDISHTKKTSLTFSEKELLNKEIEFIPEQTIEQFGKTKYFKESKIKNKETSTCNASPIPQQTENGKKSKVVIKIFKNEDGSINKNEKENKGSKTKLILIKPAGQYLRKQSFIKKEDVNNYYYNTIQVSENNSRTNERFIIPKIQKEDDIITNSNVLQKSKKIISEEFKDIQKENDNIFVKEMKPASIIKHEKSKSYDIKQSQIFKLKDIIKKEEIKQKNNFHNIHKPVLNNGNNENNKLNKNDLLIKTNNDETEIHNKKEIETKQQINNQQQVERNEHESIINNEQEINKETIQLIDEEEVYNGKNQKPFQKETLEMEVQQQHSFTEKENMEKEGNINEEEVEESKEHSEESIEQSEEESKIFKFSEENVTIPKTHKKKKKKKIIKHFTPRQEIIKSNYPKQEKRQKISNKKEEHSTSKNEKNNNEIFSVPSEKKEEKIKQILLSGNRQNRKKTTRQENNKEIKENISKKEVTKGRRHTRNISLKETEHQKTIQICSQTVNSIAKKGIHKKTISMIDNVNFDNYTKENEQSSKEIKNVKEDKLEKQLQEMFEAEKRLEEEKLNYYKEKKEKEIQEMRRKLEEIKQNEEKREKEKQRQEQLEQLKKNDLTNKQYQNNKMNSASQSSGHNEFLRNLLLRDNPNFIYKYDETIKEVEKEIKEQQKKEEKIEDKATSKQTKVIYSIEKPKAQSRNPSLAFDSSYLFTKEIKKDYSEIIKQSLLQSQKEEEDKQKQKQTIAKVENMSPLPPLQIKSPIKRLFVRRTTREPSTRFIPPKQMRKIGEKRFNIFQDSENKSLKKKHLRKEIEQKQEDEDDDDDNEPPKKTTEEMMREFFEKIKQLRNVSPEDFAKEMETFIDAQIETCDYGILKQKENRLNEFVNKLSTFRIQKEKHRQVKLNKLNFKHPYDFYCPK